MPEGTSLRALLIDFAGTLFLPLSGKQWLTAAARKAKAGLSAHDRSRLAALLDSQFHHVRDPGRDLSLAAHRRSMLPALQSLVTDKTLAKALYDLQFTGDFWHLRGGARELLRCAREQNLQVVVVSNAPWDIRPLFAGVGLRDQIHGFALSCAVGAEKPDRLIFEHALGTAGCKPSQALFIGDDPVTDSGALAAGIPVVLVPHASDNADLSLFMISGWLIATQPTTAHAHDASPGNSRPACCGWPMASAQNWAKSETTGQNLRRVGEQLVRTSAKHGRTTGPGEAGR